MSKGGGRRRRNLAREERSETSYRAVWIAVSLAAVLALELATCWGKLGRPYLDTRLHYNFDNAAFSFQARSGNRDPSLRSQFGVTLARYSRWGERIGEPAYYTDHPFLFKAVFQQFARVAGTEEWSSRVFYLALSFAAAAGTYVVLLMVTGDLLAAWAGSAVLVSLPVWAIYQTSVKVEIEGMVVSVWLFAALLARLRKPSRWTLAAYAAAVVVAWLTHWTAVLFLGIVTVYLLVAALRDRSRVTRVTLMATLLCSVLGAAALFGLMAYLQRGGRAATEVLRRAFAVRSEPVPIAGWLARQGEYFRLNFGLAPWIVLALAALVGGLWVRGRRAGEAAPRSPDRSPARLGLFFGSTLLTAAIWVGAFRQGSLIHVYWQYWFALPIAALVAAAVRLAGASGARRAWVAVAIGVVVAVLQVQARRAYADVLRDELGTPDDIELLRGLRDDRFERFVFVPVVDSSLNGWFQGPLFEYYTDRAIAIAKAPGDVRVGDKVLVLRFQQRGLVADGVARWCGKALQNEKCGARLCSYDVGPL